MYHFILTDSYHTHRSYVAEETSVFNDESSDTSENNRRFVLNENAICIYNCRH